MKKRKRKEKKKRKRNRGKAMSSDNKSLAKAKDTKNDEFYTQIADIEKEMKHYRQHFKGKTIFCNCDDPEYSNFWKFFELQFGELGLKKLIATHYETTKPSYKLELMQDINGDGKITNLDIVRTQLRQNGDFRSPECIEILKEADIIITNPPFSLIREYIAQLIEYDKKFIIIGTINALHYKEIFPLIRDNKIWTGAGFQGGNAYFEVKEKREFANGVYDSNTGLVKFRNVLWLTNLDIAKRHEVLPLYKTYTPEEYPKYINYDAIEVARVADIPIDYDGLMGVPDTFIQSYNPEQFEIIGLAESDLGVKIGVSANLTEEQKKALKAENPSFRQGNPIFRDKNGILKKPFSRIIIRRKQQ